MKLIGYNEVLGIASSNVPAYSNGDDEFISDEHHHFRGIWTGLQWQCVEYARRWLLLRKTCTFQSIDGAADAWHEVPHVERLTDGEKFPLIAHSNGSSVLPKEGSLLIYPRCQDLPFGHVGIITDVNRDYIQVAEQNYHFHNWSNDHARKIPIVYKNNKFHLEDEYEINGWMEIDEKKQKLHPLNESSLKIIHMQQS